jgi:SagB-type dehydrogenase family enzyme
MKKGMEIGDLYQKESKYFRGKLSGGSLKWDQKPGTYKEYPGCTTIQLDPPQEQGGMPLWEVIKCRRSTRNFKGQILEKDILSQLLWASQGITNKSFGSELRAVPSAGALYPVETYLVINSVQGIEPGIYHYGVKTHGLRCLKEGNFNSNVSRAALDQNFVIPANVIFIWTAIFARSKWKYGERAYRYVYLDAGHIAQNLANAAVSYGLGSCQIAALYDDEINSIIDVDGEKESVVYLTAVGHPA